MSQIKNSFDNVTLGKIKRSLLWALSGSLGVAIVNLSTQAPKDAWWGVLVAYSVPIIINAIKEYSAGKEQPLTLIAENKPYKNLDAR
jgi:hypothetical protein